MERRLLSWRDGRLESVNVPRSWPEIHSLNSLLSAIIVEYNDEVLDEVDVIPTNVDAMSLVDFIQLGDLMREVSESSAALIPDSECAEVETGDRLRAVWRGRMLVNVKPPHGWSETTLAQTLNEELSAVLSSPPLDEQAAKRRAHKRAIAWVSQFGGNYG